MASPKTLELRKADIQRDLDQAARQIQAHQQQAQNHGQQAQIWEQKQLVLAGKMQLVEEMIAEATAPTPQAEAEGVIGNGTMPEDKAADAT